MAESAAGSLAVADGHEQAAMRHFDVAREMYERAGQPYWAQRSKRLACTTPGWLRPRNAQGTRHS
jgi:hypothetical protein